MENRQKRRITLILTDEEHQIFNSTLPQGSNILLTRFIDHAIYVTLETAMTRSELVNFVYTLSDSKSALHNLFFALDAMERIRKERLANR